MTKIMLKTNNNIKTIKIMLKQLKTKLFNNNKMLTIIYKIKISKILISKTLQKIKILRMNKIIS